MYREAVDYISNIIDGKPCIGYILGSGLGDFANFIENPVHINYEDIPDFPKTTVVGHLGRFVYGQYQDKRVICMQGRFHYYEGKEMSDIITPIRVMKALGIENLIVTNAAGGINTSFTAGDIMLITDHINFSALNPLRGINQDEFGPRFPDMSYAYDPKLQELAQLVANRNGIPLKTGIYAMMQGPSYETPAEIRMLKILGADAVGMSTVPEVITAVHAGIKVLGISCITNMAAGLLDKPLNHEEVIRTAEKTKNTFIKLLKTITDSI